MITFPMVTGKNHGDKVERGDQKTPEGIYFITKFKDGNSLPPKYGGLAFVLDYPNFFDKYVKKSGDGIWIHSTDDPKRLSKAMDTDGCITLGQDHIQQLKPYITPYETPVIITPTVSTIKLPDTPTDTLETLKNQKNQFLSFLDSWKTAWESGDSDKYISYYDHKFRSQGKNRDQWKAYKENLHQLRQEKIQVITEDPKILILKDQAIITFIQKYKSLGHYDYGKKYLYLKKKEDGYKIIGESWKRRSLHQALHTPEL